MPTYAVERIDEVTIRPGSPLDGMDLMSPYVWQEGPVWRMMVRGVPDPMGPADPTGVIASAASADGLLFVVDPKLAIVPDADPAAPDAGGCEDPTVVKTSGQYVVYYTGVDGKRAQGCMMAAAGPSLDDLTKRRVVLTAPEGEGNIKEATLVQCPGGDWRLFYEYAQYQASRIGIARAAQLGEEWESLPDPFTVRDESWDDWHLSTGPIVQLPGADPVMFYNGATADARWRIGWISFSEDFSAVTGRGLEPVILPPPPKDRSATDIAFAASAVVTGDDTLVLYFSLEDRILRRATIRYYS